MSVPTEPRFPGPSEDAVTEFASLPPDETIRSVAAALERAGVRSVVVESRADAREVVRTTLPVGAEVFNNTSETLEAIGVAEDIERSGLYQPLRPRLYQMDREMQAREMRHLAVAPDFVVGSAHAVSEEGSVLIASARRVSGRMIENSSPPSRAIQSLPTRRLPLMRATNSRNT